jgi:hypothetical protein
MLHKVAIPIQKSDTINPLKTFSLNKIQASPESVRILLPIVIERISRGIVDC